MKKVFTIFSFLIIGMVAFAQQNYQDVVYLKNGSIIRGIIIEQVLNVSLKIETADKSLLVYKMDEIEKILKEPVLNANTKSESSSGGKPGYCGIFNFGYGFGIGESSKYINSLYFDFINGFQVYPYFSVGLGTGVKVWFHKDMNEKPIFIPAFVSLKGHFLKGKVSPYLGIDLGYCWEVSPITQGLGLLFSPTLGFSCKIDKMSRISFGTGYTMMHVSKAAMTIDMWNFNFGVSF